MKKYLTLSIVVILSILGCKSSVNTNVVLEDYSHTMSALMKEGIDNSYDYIPGIVLSVKSPKIENGYNGVYGFDSIKKTDSLSVDQPFRIASVTKTFVATAILKLHEEGKLSIEDPIHKYLSEEHDSLLRVDGYDTESITLYHCLNHTSGLFDYAMNGSDYVAMAKKDPKRRWTRTDQLKLAIEFGDPVGMPGEKYLYSDTGYIILGEVIEYFFNGDLAAGLRRLIDFDTLGMRHTWLETLEPEPKSMSPQIKRYFGNDETNGFDASVDLYGGGGLVSTCSDLTLFMQALFQGKIFEDQSTLELMLAKHDFTSDYKPMEDERFKDYRLGLWKVTLFGDDAYMHSGLWGTTVLYIPEQKLSLAVNFTRGWSNRLVKKVVLTTNNL